MSFPVQLLLLAFFAFVLGHILLRFARGIRTTVSDAKLGKEVHVQTPIGTFDLKPQESRDPALASILLYPGAAPLESRPPEYEADIHLLGREFQMFSAAYWTSSPVEVVWDFYKRELPDWQEDHGGAYGRELVHQAPDCTRKVQISSRDGRTLIETTATLKHGAAAAAGNSSNSNFGVLR